MTKEELNQICREYQQVLAMNEEEVFALYEESEAECMAFFEAEIDFLEKIGLVSQQSLSCKLKTTNKRNKMNDEVISAAGFMNRSITLSPISLITHFLIL